MCGNIPKLESVRPSPKYPYMPKITPGGLPVSSINSLHENIYIYTIKTQLKFTSSLRLLVVSPQQEPHT